MDDANDIHHPRCTCNSGARRRAQFGIKVRQLFVFRNVDESTKLKCLRRPWVRATQLKWVALEETGLKKHKHILKSSGIGNTYKNSTNV